MVRVSCTGHSRSVPDNIIIEVFSASDSILATMLSDCMCLRHRIVDSKILPMLFNVATVLALRVSAGLVKNCAREAGGLDGRTGCKLK